MEKIPLRASQWQRRLILVHLCHLSMLNIFVKVKFLAGSETTTSTLATFILAMTLYPDVQRKAQAEVTQAFGTNKLPQLADRDMVKLPFVEALIKETHRWNPPGNLG